MSAEPAPMEVEASEGASTTTGAAGEAGPAAMNVEGDDAAVAELEEDYLDLTDKLLLEKIAALKNEEQLVQEGTHTEFLAECGKHDKVRIERCRLAANWRDLQMENITNIYNAEVEEAETKFKSFKEGLRKRLLAVIEEKLRRLEEERAIHLGRDYASGQRKLRRRGGDNSNNTATEDDTQQEVGINRPVDYALKESEILEDLYLINRTE